MNLNSHIASLQGGSVKGEMGGKGPFALPPNHVAGMKVPVGGSCCASCKHLGADKKSCTSKYFIAWNGGSGALPAPADQYCSDWYEK